MIEFLFICSVIVSFADHVEVVCCNHEFMPREDHCSYAEDLYLNAFNSVAAPACGHSYGRYQTGVILVNGVIQQGCEPIDENAIFIHNFESGMTFQWSKTVEE